MIESPLHRAAAVLLALAAVSCADRNVGQEIPSGQVYFPLGMSVLDESSASPRVAVLSTNFDQRYRSGQLSLLDARTIANDLVTRLVGSSSTANLCDAPERPLFREDYAGAWVSRVRVPGVGGDVVRTPDGSRLYVSNRLGGEIMTIDHAAGVLSCVRNGEDTIRDLDCGPSHRAFSGAEEPFSLAYMENGGVGYLAVGHLFPYADRTNVWGVTTLIRDADLADKASGALSSDDVRVIGRRLYGTSGISGVATLGGAVKTLGLTRSGRLELNSLVPVACEDPQALEDCTLELDASARIDTLVNASDGRGLVAIDEQRLLATVLLQLPGTGRNAGLALFDASNGELRFLAATELGGELGKPNLRPRFTPDEPLIAYVGDLETDKLYAVDVTYDRPVVVAELLGRAPRDLPDGRRIQARLLDGPTRVAFARVDDRLFGFVANFSNATLTVLDATAPDPRQHCLLARYGEDVDGNGESEAERP